MKILITGGLGFQGSHLTEHFINQGHEVTVLSTLSERAKDNYKLLKNKARIVWGSITDEELIQKTVREQDVVFHLAAYINVDESIQNPHPFFEVNIGGTVNILEAIRKNNNRLIYVSSCEVYGTPVGKRLIDETTELRPHSPYAASKAAADRICFGYFKTYGLDITIVRPFNVFGERQREGKFGALIPVFVKEALDGQNLQVFGDGEQSRDYMYISDVVQAYDLVFKSLDAKGEIYNFGTGVETKVKDIAEYIAKKLNVKVEYIKARPGEISHSCADITKAKKVLGFEPKINIWEGINRYILWRKNLGS